MPAVVSLMNSHLAMSSPGRYTNGSAPEVMCTWTFGIFHPKQLCGVFRIFTRSVLSEDSTSRIRPFLSLPRHTTSWADSTPTLKGEPHCPDCLRLEKPLPPACTAPIGWQAIRFWNALSLEGERRQP